MSNLHQLFRRKFSDAAVATATATPSSLTPGSLYRETNLKRLVENFKQLSNSDRFRTKTGIYENTVRRLASAKRFKWIKEILEYQKQFKHDLAKEGFSVRLIALYGKSGMFESAQKVFEEMPESDCERTVKSMNALLGACVNSRKFDRVEVLFRELQEKLKIQPDVVSYNTVIKGLGEMGALDESISMVDEMEKKGLKPDLITFNTVLDALYSNNRFHDGEKLWSYMVEKNVVPNIRTYNARIVGLVKEKRVKEAANLIGELGNKMVEADVFSYGAVIKGYCQEGNLEEVKRWYTELIKNEFVPDKTIFSHLVSCACEKGDFDWAFELCKEIFKRKCIVREHLLQRVVDDLVKESKIEEAEQVVKMGKSNSYRRYELKMPSEV